MEATKQDIINLLSKVQKARNIIKETKIKKAGNNSFSGYDYFTPDQVSLLVNSASNEVGIIHVFSLQEDNFGLFGQLDVYDTSSGCSITSIMRTKMPSIKSTNETQEMGGCDTYTRRYMLMSMFDIADNTLDFDSRDNRNYGSSNNETPKKGLKKRAVVAEKKEDSNNGGSDMAYISIMERVKQFTSKDEIKKSSASLIEEAESNGLSTEDIDNIKSAINNKFKSL